MKKKIVWVTPDCFIDCDVELVGHLSESYDIHWVVLFEKSNNRFKESDFDKLREQNVNLSVIFLYAKYRKRYPQNILYFMKIKQIIKDIKPDLIYFNVMPSNPWVLPLYFWLPKDRTIFTAHDGRVTASMSFAKIIKFGFFKAFKSVKYVNMFSEYQAGFFNENFPGKSVMVIPLALKDFGKPTICKRKDCVGFVYFGTIHFEKNLDLLIEAANQLIEEGNTGFKISINGMWRVDWSLKDKIRHPECFELDIRNIANEEIPNLFTYNHFAVYPYKNMSQSGAIKCAFNYNTPVIVSDLKGFTDEVVDGVDGFIFKSENVEDLKTTMRKCISLSNDSYIALQNKMKEHVTQKYGMENILKAYMAMFDEVISTK